MYYQFRDHLSTRFDTEKYKSREAFGYLPFLASKIQEVNWDGIFDDALVESRLLSSRDFRIS